MLRIFKNDEIFLSAKFQFIAIEFVKLISNKPFFLLKDLNPGLKLLEFSPDDWKKPADNNKYSQILKREKK